MPILANSADNTKKGRPLCIEYCRFKRVFSNRLEEYKEMSEKVSDLDKLAREKILCSNFSNMVISFLALINHIDDNWKREQTINIIDDLDALFFTYNRDCSFLRHALSPDIIENLNAVNKVLRFQYNINENRKEENTISLYSTSSCIYRSELTFFNPIKNCYLHLTNPIIYTGNNAYFIELVNKYNFSVDSLLACIKININLHEKKFLKEIGEITYLFAKIISCAEHEEKKGSRWFSENIVNLYKNREILTKIYHDYFNKKEMSCLVKRSHISLPFFENIEIPQQIAHNLEQLATTYSNMQASIISKYGSVEKFEKYLLKEYTSESVSIEDRLRKNHQCIEENSHLFTEEEKALLSPSVKK